MHKGPTSFPVPDEVLVRRFQESVDRASFEELFVRHRERVYRACRRFLGNGEAAEDATQETFTRAYQNMHRFREGDFGWWIMKVGRNVCIDMWRKQRPQAQMESADWTEELTSPAEDADSDLHLAIQRLREELLRLPEEQRRCLEMKIEGYSYQETAERTGFTVEAVKSYLQNGRRMLWLKMEGMLSQLR